MKTLALLLSSMVAGTCAMAQIPVTGSSLAYNQDFNSLDTVNTNSSTLPAGWAIKETGSSATTVNNQYKGNAGTSTTGETYSYGTAGSTDRALGSIASTSNKSSYGARFVNNTADSIISFTISYNGEQWRRGSNSSPDSLAFSYSLNADSVGDAGAIWTTVNSLSLSSINTATTTGIALDGNLNSTMVSGSVNAIIHQGEILTIKWNDIDVNGSDDGLAIDDLSITFTPASPPAPDYHPNSIALSPADNSNGVPTTMDTLQIIFDRQVAVGSGNVTIKNETDQTMQIIVISPANTTVSTYIAAISGMVLLPGKNYHVTFDSTAFDTAGYRCAGIYDTAAWNFSTVSLPLPAVTSLNENFDTSCGSATSNLPTGWIQYSITGVNQQWNCTSNGNNGTPGVQMNGYVNQTGNLNEDWLISPQLSLTAMTEAYLHFDHWKRFTSSDELEVLISHNYTGSGDPNSAMWINLNAIPSSPADTAIWNMFESPITAYTSQPFYLAFKYVSSIVDGYLSKLDNIFISPMPTKAMSIHNALADFMLLGSATRNEVTLGLNVDEGDYKIQIYDLMGREIYNHDKHISSGVQKIIISGFSLTKGMYIIKLSNNITVGAVKFLIE